MPELAPVTPATRWCPPAAFIETTLINVLNSRSAPQRPVQQHGRMSFRGVCVLLPRTLPLLISGVARDRPSELGQRTLVRSTTLTHSHLSPSRKSHLRLHRQIMPPALH